tara:strand:+ start:589 stop:1041 length:453 start_codon:yes stop_codon:yes gene_type:complete
MKIQDRIDQDIKESMINKQTVRLESLRSIKASFLLEMSKDGSDSITDETAQKIILRLAKQRKESASIYSEKKRHDLEEIELNQLKYLEFYLPEQMSELEVRRVIQGVINSLGASTITDMGKCMSLAMKKLEGKSDGKLISNIVKEELLKS